MATLSDEIHDRPTIFAPLKMIETEIGQFASPKTATQQDGNDRSVALTLEGFGIRGLPQVPSFFCGQPNSQPNAKSLDAFYASDVGCQLWAQYSGIRSFVRQSPNASQPHVDSARSEIPRLQVNLGFLFMCSPLRND